LIPWIAATGVLGLLGVAFLERFIFILPSSALLVAMGIAAAGGHWSLLMAFWTSTAGSLLGCISIYVLGLALDARRSDAVVKRSARILGISQARLGRLMISFHHHERTFAFASQLIPSVRLIAPGIAGLVRARPRAFFMATTFGVALWNSLFIGMGYAAALIDESANASAVALKVVFVLLVGEGLAAAVWRGMVVWGRRVRPEQCAAGN
jgi:membrane protein DedA with SNARE-associated domain